MKVEVVVTMTTDRAEKVLDEIRELVSYETHEKFPALRELARFLAGERE